jgi:hypothetical protein
MDSDKQVIFSIQESFLGVLQSWGWLLAFMISGALAGWIFTRVQPVIYEASASMNFRVDYVRTGAISDIRVDALLSWPEDIFYSPEVVDQVLSLAMQRGSKIDEKQFQEHSSLERQDTRWAMVVRNPSADEAAFLVNDWVKASEVVFRDSLVHSMVVDELHRYQDGVVSCLEQTAMLTSCPFNSMADLQVELNQSTAMIEIEEKLARGGSSAIHLVGIQTAEGSPNAVLYIHNQVIAGGAILGAIIGIIFIETSASIRRRSAKVA